MHPCGLAPYSIHRRPAIFALALGPSGELRSFNSSPTVFNGCQRKPSRLMVDSEGEQGDVVPRRPRDSRLGVCLFSLGYMGSRISALLASPRVSLGGES